MPKYRRRLPAAVGVLAGSSALLMASFLSNGVLRAVQDESAVAAPASQPAQTPLAGLRIPADITEEAIEQVDEAMARNVAPLMRRLFDGSQPVESRLTAASELKNLIAGISDDTGGYSSLKSRLDRRVSLMEAGLKAAAVEDISAAPEASAAAVNSAAAETAKWLKQVRNGALWTEFLHLSDLQAARPDVGVLKQVQKNLTPADSSTEEQNAFLERPYLLSLKAVIDAAIAATSYESDESGARAELQRQIDSLIGALLSYETNRLAQDAEAARASYRILKGRFPAAAAAVRPQMMTYFFNHNLHFTVSENLLSRLVSDYRTESGRIADCIMGAWVTGSQVTSVNVSADIRPSTTSALFSIQASGNTQSNTIARKDPATVRTLGNHHFFMSKPVEFVGRDLTSRRGGIHVDVNSRTVGVSTKYDGIPLFGGIIRKIAIKEVAKSKGQSDAITRQRLSDEALPKFENEVSEQLTELESSLRKTLDSLDARGVGPESISARSSNTHIAVSSRTMGVSRLGGSVQPPVLLSAKGMAVQLHESAMNNTLDALGFNGRTIAEKEVLNELEKSLSDLLQREVRLRKDDTKAPAADAPAADAPAEEPEPPTTFVFSSTDPMRAHFDDNQLVLVLRTAVLQEGKEDIPEQVITIPITISLADGKLVLDPGTIGVNSREETNRVKQITRANQIRRILGREIVRRELDTTFDIQAAGDRSLMLTLTMIRLEDGWLTAEIQ